jgi:hypothetical protein
MFRMKLIATVFAAILLNASAFAGSSSPSFTTIDDPGDPTFNQLLGINNDGVISGYFGSGAVGHPNQGYTIAPPYTAFLSDNLPGSLQTQATGINVNGITVGFWAPTNTGNDSNFGFIRLANGFTYLSVNDPLGTGSPEVNQLLGINTDEIAVGFYNDANGLSHGYTYTVKTGVFKPVGINGSTSDAATGINNNNLICGFFTNTEGRTRGFLKPLTGGTAILFSVPDAPVTQLLGVNDSGVAVGFYADSTGLTHGLVYLPSTGQWNTVDDPDGPMGTVLNGVNDKGDMVGFYIDAAGNTHGMLVTGAQ